MIFSWLFLVEHGLSSWQMKICSQDGEDIIGEKKGVSIFTVILHFTLFNLYTSVNAIEL
jgi:hypothetical protein